MCDIIELSEWTLFSKLINQFELQKTIKIWLTEQSAILRRIYTNAAFEKAVDDKNECWVLEKEMKNAGSSRLIYLSHHL